MARGGIAYDFDCGAGPGGGKITLMGIMDILVSSLKLGMYGLTVYRGAKITAGPPATQICMTIDNLTHKPKDMP